MAADIEDTPGRAGRSTSARVLALAEEVARLAASKAMLARVLRGGPLGIALGVAQVLLVLRRRRRAKRRLAAAQPRVDLPPITIRR